MRRPAMEPAVSSTIDSFHVLQPRQSNTLRPSTTSSSPSRSASRLVVTSSSTSSPSATPISQSRSSDSGGFNYVATVIVSSPQYMRGKTLMHLGCHRCNHSSCGWQPIMDLSSSEASVRTGAQIPSWVPAQKMARLEASGKVQLSEKRRPIEPQREYIL